MPRVALLVGLLLAMVALTSGQTCTRTVRRFGNCSAKGSCCEQGTYCHKYSRTSQCKILPRRSRDSQRYRRSRSPPRPQRPARPPRVDPPRPSRPARPPRVDPPRPQRPARPPRVDPPRPSRPARPPRVDPPRPPRPARPPRVDPPRPSSPSSGTCGRLSFDTSKYDSHYPVMKEFMKAGVRGGIPCYLPTKARVRPGSSIQNAIDSAARGGGGVVLLLAGDHRVTKELHMKSNVVLRGEGKGRTRLVVTFRSYGNRARAAINAVRVRKAGIENLTMFFSVPGYEPLDRNNYGESRVNSPWPWVNGVKVKKGDRSRKTVKDGNLRVGFLRWKSSQDMWLLNCELLEAGTNPISVDDKSSYMTFKGNFINRSYNKGGSGNAYFDVRGQYILLLENKIRKIRHVCVWKGAKYVVIYKNDLEVDINFHGADKGSNLMEKNRSKLPHAHHWPNVATGGAHQHKPPGRGNLIFDNDIDHKRRASLTAEDRRSVYTVTGFKKVEKRGRSPRGGTFFPMK